MEGSRSAASPVQGIEWELLQGTQDRAAEHVADKAFARYVIAVAQTKARDRRDHAYGNNVLPRNRSRDYPARILSL